MNDKQDQLDQLISQLAAGLLPKSNKLLTIHDDYIHIAQEKKEDSFKGFIHEQPLSALSQFVNYRFDSIISFSQSWGKPNVTWINKDPAISITGPERWVLIYKALILLSDQGNAIILTDPGLWSTKKGKNILNELEEKKLYLRALFELPPNSIEFTAMRPYLCYFSREKNKKLYIAEINESSNIEGVILGYKFQKSGDNLYEGIEVDRDSFKSFQSYKVAKEFASLAKQYQSFERIKIKEIVKKVITSEFVQDDCSVYIRMAGNFKAVHFDEITKNKYIQLKLDSKKVNPKYLHYFLNSELGQKFLNSYSSGSFIPQLITEDLLQAELYLLPHEMQIRTIEAVSDVNLIVDKLKGFETSLLYDPSKANKVDQDLDDLLSSLTTLTKEEELLSRIRKGEDAHTEFKSTLRWDIHQNKIDKAREHDVLRTICGFMNSGGGVLFIGVEDNGNLVGLDAHTFSNNDKFLLHFKNLFKEQIGASYYPLIDYEIISLLSHDILVVSSKKSKSPVYLGRDALFYVRSNPSTDELKGREMVQYIDNHF